MLGNNLGLMQTATSSGATYTYATWDAATKGSDITLSNGNLTAASNYTVVGNHCVVGTIGKSSGKWYWEVRFDAIAANSVYPMLGIARASFLSVCSTTDYPGKTADSWGYYGSSGQQYNNATSSAFGAAYAVGDILGFALDADARSCQVYKNGVLQGTWSSIPGTDAIYPVGIESSTVTANFGATMLKFQAPAGYNAGLFTASGLPTFATWNPSDKSANITLSSENLKGTQSAAGMVRSSLSQSSGKWYWEVTVGSVYGMHGIANASVNTSYYPGQAANSWGWNRDGNMFNGGSVIGANSAYTTWDVLGFALDCDAGTLTFYKNGAVQSFVVTGLSGSLYPASGGASTGATYTANFGATPFTYAPPAGYSHGVASTAYTPTINYATWDANDKSSLTTLSNANLTETTTSGNGGVHSTVGKSRGKWYWETTVVTNAQLNIGAGTFAAGVNGIPGNISGSVAWNPSGGNLRYNGATGYSLPNMSAGDVAGIAVDDTTGTVTFYKNGGLAGGPYSVVTAGTHYFAFDGSFGSAADTANFGATALKYAPPAGYSWGVGDRPTPFSRSYATWNPADKAASVSLSGGNLTTTATNSGSVRATLGKTSGKWYFECTITTVGQIIIGISNGTHTITQYPGFNANSIGYEYGGNVMYNASVSTSYSAYTNGAVIGVAYDASTGSVTFYKNGVLQGTPSATITGTIYPNIGSQGASTGVVTTNFGATPFAYPAPTGYTGLY